VKREPPHEGLRLHRTDGAIGSTDPLVYHLVERRARTEVVIAESLAGKRIAITGSTGFVGTALVERLLRAVPGCELVLLVRDGKRTPAARRVQRELLNNDAFDRLRAEHGRDGFAELTGRRIRTIRGDVGRDGLGVSDDDKAVLASCDVVIHSAATVSFDSPLDAAVEINLLGPTRIAALLNDLDVAPHVVSVSTCYVAGNRRGNAPEELVSAGPFDLGLRWQDEVTAARRLRSDNEATSRQPEQLTRFRADARRELGAAGAPALAAKTEQLRERWVRDRLIEAGRARAASVGWPDAYAFTKALGEQALIDSKGAVPVSIVRPSIIESAWAEPRPGWIRGFRMAEPVILSYARGLLREFPGIPEGTVDVIPVDLVVAAIITTAANGPERAPAICQVASGAVNPLKYRTLVDNIRGWFTEHPIYDAAGQPIIVPEWRFPGRGRVQGQLTRVKSTISRGERLLHALPLRGKQAELSARLETKRQDVERALEYVELYGLYTECEAIYQVDELLTMWEALDADDRAAFNFDPRSVDWTRYVREIHLPSIVKHARVKTAPGKTTTDRAGRLRRQVLSPDRHLAAFDLENTLIASNVVESYTWMATRRLDNRERLRYVLHTIAEAPRLLRLDRADRTDFLRHFYRRYENAPVEQIAEEAGELLADVIMTKSFPAGLRRVREHRALGHRTVLITGALDFAVDGLRPLFDEIIAAEMSRKPDGTYSGEMTAVPPTGEARAQIMAEYAAAEGLDLAEAVAYADSSSDLPMLEAVGFPVAVNPETRLAAIARKRGWLVEQWSKASGAGGRPFPMAPVMTERERRRAFQ
jgi:fatty acyl-CoA reductase